MSEDFSTLLEESISKLQVKAGTIINGTVIMSPISWLSINLAHGFDFKKFRNSHSKCWIK